MKICFSNFAMGPFSKDFWSLVVVFCGSDSLRFFCHLIVHGHAARRSCSARLQASICVNLQCPPEGGRYPPHIRALTKTTKPMPRDSPPRQIRVLLDFAGR